MKILIIEDGKNNIESLKIQINESMGSGHELTLVQTAKELREYIPKIRNHEFDLVLTDMYLPVGLDSNYGPDLEPTSLQPAGLIAVIEALYAGVACYLCTDANGHRDLLGLLLEASDDGSFCSENKGVERKLFSFITRPNMHDGKAWAFNYMMQEGSNWAEFLKSKKAGPGTIQYE